MKVEKIRLSWRSQYPYPSTGEQTESAVEGTGSPDQEGKHHSFRQSDEQRPEQGEITRPRTDSSETPKAEERHRLDVVV